MSFVETANALLLQIATSISSLTARLAGVKHVLKLFHEGYEIESHQVTA